MNSAARPKKWLETGETASSRTCLREAPRKSGLFSGEVLGREAVLGKTAMNGPMTCRLKWSRGWGPTARATGEK